MTHDLSLKVVHLSLQHRSFGMIQRQNWVTRTQWRETTFTGEEPGIFRRNTLVFFSFRHLRSRVPLGGSPRAWSPHLFYFIAQARRRWSPGGAEKWPCSGQTRVCPDVIREGKRKLWHHGGNQAPSLHPQWCVWVTRLCERLSMALLASTSWVPGSMASTNSMNLLSTWHVVIPKRNWVFYFT